MAEQDRFEFVNEVGVEAYELIATRMKELGPLSFMELFSAMVGAATICLANALRPGVERAPKRAAAADSLVASSMKQVRSFLESVVQEERAG